MTATNLITSVATAATSVTLSGGVATALLPIAVTTDLGPVQLVWESGGETITTHLDVRGSRLPVFELPRANPSGSLNPPAGSAWRAERALSDALIEFEDACKDVPMSPRRVQVTPTVCGSRITWGVPRVHRVVSCSDPSVDVSSIVIGPAYAQGSAPAGATFVVEHGETTLAPDVRRAIVLLASSRLADGPADPRGFLLHAAGAIRLRRPGAQFDIEDVEMARKRHTRILIR